MIIGIVVAVVLIGGAAYFMSQNKSTDTNTTAQNQTSSEEKTAMEKKEGVLVGGAMMTPDRDIVDNAVDSKDHTTLVAAVKAAGLVETLKGAGPFTVFAPTNAAFEKLPAGTVETLVKPENKEKLTGILTYHVVSGSYKAADLTDGMTLKTVQGEEITLSQKDGKWWINGSAMIEIADVISSNGVTYVIDTVIMPPSMSGGEKMMDKKTEK